MIKVFIPYKESSDFWFVDKLLAEGHDVEGFGNPYKKLSGFKRIIKYALWCRKKLGAGDFALFWNPEPAIFLSALSVLMPSIRRTPILALHSFFKFQSRKSNALWKVLFFCASKNKNFFMTVNSEYEKQSYSKQFYIGLSNIFVVPDSYEDDQKDNIIDEYVEGNNNYIFTGGNSQRDWTTFIDAASDNPNMNFMLVTSPSLLGGVKIPDNVRVRYNIPLNEYNECIRKADFVIVPLKEKIASGLLLLVQAGLMHRPVIATDTPCTRNYIRDGKGGLLVSKGNKNELSDAIRTLAGSAVLRKKYADALHERILECSPGNYVKSIQEIIRHIEEGAQNVRSI